MKRVRWIVLLTAVTLAACTEAEADLDDLLAWEFPAEVAKFDLVSLAGGVEAGELIAGYNLQEPRSPVAVTVYVYPAPSFISVASSADVKDATRSLLFQQHFELTQDAVTENDPSARLVSSGEASLRQRDAEQPGLLAEYDVTASFAGQMTDLASFLYLFQDGDWLVKYRVTYPALLGADGERLAAEFMEGLTWPPASE